MLEGREDVRTSQLHQVVIPSFLRMRFFMPWGAGMSMQSRPDRGNFIMVNWANIRSGRLLLLVMLLIIELVDSICRDSADVSYMLIQKDLKNS